MKTISVNTGHPYQIHIGRGLLECIPKLLSPVCGARRPKLAVITDHRVDSLAFPDGRQPAQTLLTAFEKAGYSVCKFVFPNGEASKTLDTVRQAYAFFSEHEITRTDMVVAFGGGVVGDLAGFAAASLPRADLRGALSDALPGISGRRLVRYAGNAPCAPGNGRKLDAGGKYGCL